MSGVFAHNCSQLLTTMIESFHQNPIVKLQGETMNTELVVLGVILIFLGLVGAPFTCCFSLIVSVIGIILIVVAADEDRYQFMRHQQAYYPPPQYHSPQYHLPQHQYPRDQAPYPGPAQPPQHAHQAPRCPQCGGVTRYSEEERDYYCEECYQYIGRMRPQG